MTNCVAGANAARGLSNPSNSATRSWARPVSARNRTDSGSRSARIGTNIKGATPPTTNTERQPNCGINAAASRPPSAAPAARIELGRHGNGIRHRTTETETGQKPDREQCVDVLDERGDERAEAECKRGENDDLLAPDAVRKRAEQQCADHQSEQPRTEHRAERAFGQAPF